MIVAPDPGPDPSPKEQRAAIASIGRQLFDLAERAEREGLPAVAARCREIVATGAVLAARLNQ